MAIKRDLLARYFRSSRRHVQVQTSGSHTSRTRARALTTARPSSTAELRCNNRRHGRAYSDMIALVGWEGKASGVPGITLVRGVEGGVVAGEVCPDT